MTRKHLAALMALGAFGLSGLALFTPTRVQKWLRETADDLTRAMVEAVEDAMDVFDYDDEEFA